MVDHGSASSRPSGWQPIKQQCAKCGGDGQMIVGEHRVTRDMAIDAGEPAMEGSFHSYATDRCDACGGSGHVEVVPPGSDPPAPAPPEAPEREPEYGAIDAPLVERDPDAAFDECYGAYPELAAPAPEIEGRYGEVCKWLVDIEQEHLHDSLTAQQLIESLRQEIARLTAELAEWRTLGIIEIAIRNPNVASYMDHWEKRAEQAEADVMRLTDELRVTDELLTERQSVLDAIPPCHAHGPCVPHALEWIKLAKSSRPQREG